MKKYIFIADVHLNNYELKKLEFFKKFLLSNKIDTNTHIYIIGDYLDFWFENKKFDLSEEYDNLIGIKKIIEQKKLKVYLIKGNRDFLAGPKFEFFSGVKIIGEDLYLTVNNKKYYLTHGDVFSTRDKSYIIWRSISRNRLIKTITNYIPKKIILKLISNVRDISSIKNARLKTGIGLIVYKEILKKIIKENLDCIICGHNHKMLQQSIKIKNSHRLFFVLHRWTDKFAYYLSLKETDTIPKIKLFNE